MSLPLVMASSIRRTELSRATASGMNEFGKRTVSRSGRIGSSDGMLSGRWRIAEGGLRRIRNPQSAIKNGVAGGEGMGSATGGAPYLGTPDAYMSRKSELAPRRALS